MQTRVRFTRFGHNTALGNFGPGDVAVCGESMARHLVDQVRCARYDQPAGAATSLPAPPKRQRGPRKAAGAAQA